MLVPHADLHEQRTRALARRLPPKRLEELLRQRERRLVSGVVVVAAPVAALVVAAAAEPFQRLKSAARLRILRLEIERCRAIGRARVDSRAQRREIDLGRLSKCVEEARGRTEAMTKLYFAAGCMVCTEPVKSVIASDATWENPGLAVIDQFETRLNQRPERTAEEEKYARRLGFRPD